MKGKAMKLSIRDAERELRKAKKRQIKHKRKVRIDWAKKSTEGAW